VQNFLQGADLTRSSHRYRRLDRLPSAYADEAPDLRESKPKGCRCGNAFSALRGTVWLDWSRRSSQIIVAQAPVKLRGWPSRKAGM